MRVTVDLDSWWFTDLQRTILKAIEVGIGLPDKIRKSPTKRGYHLIWYGLNLSNEDVTKIREALNDDPLRIQLDKERPNKPKQVLFTRKKIYNIRPKKEEEKEK